FRGGALLGRGIGQRLAAKAWHPALPVQPREDLPDCAEVIRRVGRRGESGGRAHVVPARPRRDDLTPFVSFAAKTVAQGSPLVVGHRGAPPTGVPVGAGPRVRVALGPAVQNGEAKM